MHSTSPHAKVIRKDLAILSPPFQEGIFKGEVGKINLSPEARDLSYYQKVRKKINSTFIQKKWIYCCISTPEILFSCAIIDAGYIGRVFYYLCNLTNKTKIGSLSHSGIPNIHFKINDHPTQGLFAFFNSKTIKIEIKRHRSDLEYRLLIESKELGIDALFNCQQAPPPIWALGLSSRGLPVFTQKSNLLNAKGKITYRSQKWNLENSFAGLDYTLGYLPHITHWRWAFGLGNSFNQPLIGFNLANGNNLGSQTENIFWLDQQVYSIPPVQFDFDPEAPLAPWKVRSIDSSLDLNFIPCASHNESRHFWVAQSQFHQLAGYFNGHFRTPSGQIIPIKNLPGVTEDLFAKW